LSVLVQKLDRIEARAAIDAILETGLLLKDKILYAWHGEAWDALGYDSWDDLCAQELHALELEIPRDDRREIVMSLRKEGMSLRAIASATGVGKSTIERDLASVPPNQENGTLEVIDVDAEEDSGDWYCQGGGHDVAAAIPSEQVGSRLCCPQCADEWRPPTVVKGRNGKSYTAPKPKPTPPPPPPKPQTMLTLFTHEGTPVQYPQPQSKPTFNNTSGPGISWAEWSWNPVTGCLHGCDYCYAREIANSNRAAATYPVGFTPLFHSERLDAPVNTSIPMQYRDDSHEPCGDGKCKICAYRRVFVCSMADLYGRWVPDEWIEKVHASMLDSPQWQYILLTKFPSRYVGLALPDGAFVGTSVDEQKRVRIAQDAFAKLPDNVIKWLSLEPLREPLQFDDLSMFDWVVIGAQTATTQPSGFLPAFAPEFDWVVDIYQKAREAGCKVHFKPNIMDGKPGMRFPDEYPTGH
jgi:protein gp37/lambda repressor-like predicted transcriptional regulator